MQTEVPLSVVLPGGVRLDASIFDDRNYVEIDDAWLASAAERISRTHRVSTQTALSTPDHELNA
jgi:hypothetical protein